MNLKDTVLLLTAFRKTMGNLFLFLAFGLFLDSKYLTSYVENGQLYANCTILCVFIFLYYKASPRIKELMIYAVLIGFLGEHLFSIWLNMYTYRLGNVPLYVPLGHAIVYIVAIYFCKSAIVKKYRRNLEQWFAAFIILYAFLLLILANDIFGFVMSILVIVLLIKQPRERLFFFSMYIIVAFLEIIGTSYGCWYWPETAFRTIPFLKSANPPSGISLFYFLLDLGCLWFYKQRNLIAWKKMKRIRNLQEIKISTSG